jgi:hypothetical protein
MEQHVEVRGEEYIFTQTGVCVRERRREREYEVYEKNDAFAKEKRQKQRI